MRSAMDAYERALSRRRALSRKMYRDIRQAHQVQDRPNRVGLLVVGVASGCAGALMGFLFSSLS